MKTVAFTSAHPGAGATTLAALIGLLWADEGLVFADCDAETGALAASLGARDVLTRPIAGAGVAVVDQVVCRGCGACVRACRFDAFVQGRAGFARPTLAVDALVCQGCGACVPQCPDRAISVEARVMGSVTEADTAAGPVVHGAVEAGADLASALAAEVREAAHRIAREREAGFVVVDAPPGAGAAAAAATRGADLVVAVAGPAPWGAEGIRRLAKLASRLDVPVAVVLNKADLWAEGADDLKRFAEDEGLALAGEVPFDRALLQLLDASGPAVTQTRLRSCESPSALAVLDAAERIAALLEAAGGRGRARSAGRAVR